MLCRDTHAKTYGNNYRTLLFPDLDATDIIITDIIIHAKIFFCVIVMSMIIMTDLRYMFYKCFNKYHQFQLTVSTVTGEVSRNVLKHAELELKPELGPVLTLHLNMGETIALLKGLPWKQPTVTKILVQVIH